MMGSHESRRRHRGLQSASVTTTNNHLPPPTTTIHSYETSRDRIWSKLASSADPAVAERRPAIGFVNVDITSETSVQRAVAGYDLVVHTAGPFQTLKRPLVLETCARAGVPYLDVCDGISLCKQGKELEKVGAPCITAAGIWPGTSALMAAEAVGLLREETPRGTAGASSERARRGAAARVVEGGRRDQRLERPRLGTVRATRRAASRVLAVRPARAASAPRPARSAAPLQVLQAGSGPAAANHRRRWRGRLVHGVRRPTRRPAAVG